jgi:hypothetical protein
LYVAIAFSSVVSFAKFSALRVQVKVGLPVLSFKALRIFKSDCFVRNFDSNSIATFMFEIFSTTVRDSAEKALERFVAIPQFTPFRTFNLPSPRMNDQDQLVGKNVVLLIKWSSSKNFKSLKALLPLATLLTMI